MTPRAEPLDPGAPEARLGAALTWACALTALGLAAMAVVGVLARHAILPDQDIWDGLIEAYLGVSQGDWRAWWAQYPEHRPVITRVLFWVDERWLGGSVVFLFVCSLAVLGLTAWLFARLAADATAGEPRWLGWLTAGWLFLYTQAELFASAMASCFYLAYLLPLAAFHALHRAASGPVATRQACFGLALACGVAAVGSQGNGLLTLPVMVVLAVCMRLPWRQVLVVAGVAALCVGAYLADYRRPQGLGSIALALSRPADVLTFVLGFFGSPFFWLAGKGLVGGGLAVVAGAGWLALLCAVGWRLLRRRGAALNSAQWALLALLGYLLASALLAASGRLVYGPSTSVSSRYTLPALLGWSAAVVLAAPLWGHALRRRWVAWPVGLLLAGALFFQAQALSRVLAPVSGAQQLALWQPMLALELGVPDMDTLRGHHPDVARLVRLADEAVRRDVSVFGKPPLQGARDLLGTRVTAPAAAICTGQLRQVMPVANQAWKVQASLPWAGADAVSERWQRLLVLDAQSHVVGVLFRHPKSMRHTEGPDGLPETANAVGYVLGGAPWPMWRIVDEQAACVLAATPP